MTLTATNVSGTGWEPRGLVRAGSLMLKQDQCRCLICETPFAVGQPYSMLETNPINNDEARRASMGLRYVSYFEPAHWECAVIRLATVAGFMRQRAYA
jgi:hypothetical protein